MEIELNIPETEITGNDISVETGNTNIAVSDDTKDLDITYNRKEYSIIGDGIFISSVLDDVPEWLGDLIDSTFEAAILSRDQNLINRMEAILTALDYVPKNRYTEQINQIVDEDGIINTRIATLNSNLTDALTTANATIAEINLTYASKNEAAAIATNVLTASLSADGEIGSTLIELQTAYADLESTTAESIILLESVMEGEINGNASAMQTIRSYVGINEAGASTGTGTLNIILNNIQNQVDGSISTWFYDAEPTLVNLPASEWTTTETRNIHLGDIYYDRLTGFAYRFAFEDIEDIPDAGTIYTWIRITDSDITKALADAAQAQETADGKITTFYQSTPPTAEGTGDIWIDSDAGNKMYRWNGTTWGSDLVGTMVANAEAVTTLEADLSDTNIVVGGHTTQLSTVNTRIADGVASVETKWAYNSVVNINGIYKKSGFGLTTNYTSGSGTEANPYVSEFWIDASRLKFTNSDKTGRTAPFTIDASGTTPQVTFNGKVTFSNITDVPSLGTSNSNNLLINAGPVLGNETYGWDSNNYNTNIVPNAVAAGFDSWRPTGAGSVYVVVGGAPTVGTVFDVRQTAATAVVAGKRYEVSALISSHRCTSVCTVAFYNSVGTYISEIGAGTANSAAYSGDLGSWVRQGGFVTVPVGAAMARFYVRSTVTSTDPYCFVSQAYMGEVPNDKTEFSSWGEGVSANSTTIDGGKIVTNTLYGNRLIGNTVSADKLTSSTGTSTTWTGGGLVSQNFNGNVAGYIGNPTQGFRLSSNAAGTSADPNIYGAYIKGATLEGTSLTVNDVKVKAVGYSNNFGPLTLNKNYGFVQGDSLSNPPLYSDTFISRQEGIGYSSLRLCATTSTIEVYGTAEIKGGNNYYVTATIQKSINGGSWTNVATSSSNVKAGIISATIIHDTSSSIRIRLVPWVQYSSDANDWILQLKISINNYE